MPHQQIEGGHGIAEMDDKVAQTRWLWCLKRQMQVSIEKTVSMTMRSAPVLRGQIFRCAGSPALALSTWIVVQSQSASRPIDRRPRIACRRRSNDDSTTLCASSASANRTPEPNGKTQGIAADAPRVEGPPQRRRSSRTGGNQAKQPGAFGPARKGPLVPHQLAIKSPFVAAFERTSPFPGM